MYELALWQNSQAIHKQNKEIIIYKESLDECTLYIKTSKMFPLTARRMINSCDATREQQKQKSVLSGLQKNVFNLLHHALIQQMKPFS